LFLLVLAIHVFWRDGALTSASYVLTAIAHSYVVVKSILLQANVQCYDSGPSHLFRKLPLPLRFLHWHEIILLGDRDTKVKQLAKICYAAAPNCMVCMHWDVEMLY